MKIIMINITNFILKLDKSFFFWKDQNNTMDIIIIFDEYRIHWEIHYEEHN